MIPKLQTAVLQVTTACPLSCAQCYMDHTGVHMQLAAAQEILLQVKVLGAELVQLTGGGAHGLSAAFGRGQTLHAAGATDGDRNFGLWL